VIYNHYGGASTFPGLEGMMAAVDKSDSGDLTADEVENPGPWLLLAFIVDPRTGLGRFDEFSIGTMPLMELLLQHLGEMSIESILALPDVAQRVEKYREQNALYKDMIRRRAVLRGKVLVIDLRPENFIAAGNRFVEYVMFPEATVSVRVMWGFQRQNVVFAVGHSIINRYAAVNVGSLMLKYGGGGHPQVGTCQVEADRADQVLAELVEALDKDS
jgi:nanoRNase/pAp phosphatase (c-di-AMP/oligoRNAs hydrolase)